MTEEKQNSSKSKPIKQQFAISDVSKHSSHDTQTSSVSFNVNEFKDSGLTLDAKIILLSPSLHKEHLSIRALHNFPEDSTLVINVSIEIKHKNISKIDELLPEYMAIFDEMNLDQNYSFILQGSILNFGFYSTETDSFF